MVRNLLGLILFPSLVLASAILEMSVFAQTPSRHKVTLVMAGPLARSL